ncbi:MAG: saccharopine dehydrogenase [Deltaproteobacteria bacterium]|nr:saccharopine dehydrogenase [Deltaproteobacteria bacterium]
MTKVVVLGGCGAVGSVAVKTLAGQEIIDEIVIGDINMNRADQIIQECKSEKISAIQVDVTDVGSIKEAISDCEVVLNCVGPFYKTVKPILKAVIDSKINYVDVCDDVDVTIELFDMHQEAQAAGVAALIGMGSSPGATNLLAKFASDELLDTTDTIDIFHAHGGEPVEGEGVIGHRFHCMSIDIPMFLDGELKYVKYFEEDGIALRERFDFPVLSKNIELFPYPHPEQVTLPKYIDTKRVTNKGTVLPSEYYDLTGEMCRLGLNSKEPLDVKGQTVVPYDFAIAHILKERERILRETNFGDQRGCVSIVVFGKKDGECRGYRFHLASRSQALGEGTGIPAAIGVMMMVSGQVLGKGVMPPEACIKPPEFLELVPRVMTLDKNKEGGNSFGGVIVEQVSSDGTVTKLNI